MPALIMLVNANARTLRHAGAALEEAGYLVEAVSTFAEARKLLDIALPDVLVADVQLEAFNGLHLAIRSQHEHPDLPVIVTHPSDDPFFENEAKRHGADFVARPADNPAFLAAVEGAVGRRRRGMSPIRRWTRKAVTDFVQVVTGDAEAQLLDVSYGGFRLAFKGAEELPPMFEVMVPPAGVTVKAHRVWTAHGDSDQFWCGAELQDELPRQWKQFVDSFEPSFPS
jgi:DNA-binding NtrC family response regulator